MNNKVKFLRGTSNEYAAAEKDSDTIYFTTDDGKLYIGDKEVSGDGSITIDDTLSDTSTNPVQNKVVKQAIDNKADKTVATTSADGLMSAEDKGKLDSVDDTYALKSLYGDTTINVGRKTGTDVGIYSTAEGYQTTASGSGSTAGGYQSTASGICSHAEGYKTTASGDHSHTCGLNTKALHDVEVAYGKYNQSNSDTLFSIGDGIADDARHNAFEITTTGGKLHDKDIAVKDDIINSNLLINPDFKINQRGVASGDTLVYGRYSLDRWRILYSNLDYKKSINITSDGIELVTANDSVNGYYGDFLQPFENPLPSGYYTMSGKIDGVIRTFTGYLEENEDSILFDGVFVLAHTSFGIRVYDDTRKIEWVKLEAGQVATSFAPPDPALELVKCQRFYREIVGQFIPTIITSNMTSTYITIDNMRISTNDDGSSLLPTAYFKNTMFNANAGTRVTNNSGSVISGFVFSITTVDKGRLIEVRAKKASHGLDRNTHVFVIDTDNPICVGAEI